MKLSRKISRYLKGSIDFSSFYIMDVIPQNKKYAVVLLAPIKKGEFGYFNLQYMDNSLYYSNIEEMMENCIHSGYISRLRATILAYQYNKKQNKIMEDL